MRKVHAAALVVVLAGLPVLGGCPGSARSGGAPAQQTVAEKGARLKELEAEWKAGVEKGPGGLDLPKLRGIVSEMETIFASMDYSPEERAGQAQMIGQLRSFCDQMEGVQGR